MTGVVDGPRKAPVAAALNVFLSYRRDDSSEASQSLYEKLSRSLHGWHIFRDLDTLPHGLSFKSVIEAEIATCDVLVAVVGPKWLAATDELGRRRLDHDEDLVRLEIESALNRGVAVIIALVDGAPAPPVEALPRSLLMLATCPVIRVGSERRVDTLCAAIRLAPRAPQRQLALRERFYAALEVGTRQGISWAVMGAIISTLGTVALAIGVQELSITLFMEYLGLLVVPVIIGFATGKELRGWRSAVLGALLFPAIIEMVFMLITFAGIMLAKVGHAYLYGTEGSAEKWQVGIGGLAYSGAVACGFLALRAVTRHRVRRIRVGKAARSIAGMAALGAGLGVGVGYLVVWVMPPGWLGSEQTLMWTGLLTSIGVTLGVIHGSLTGYSPRFR